MKITTMRKFLSCNCFSKCKCLGRSKNSLILINKSLKTRKPNKIIKSKQSTQISMSVFPHLNLQDIQKIKLSQIIYSSFKIQEIKELQLSKFKIKLQNNYLTITKLI